GDFFIALAGTGYFLPLLAATETVAGAALLARRFVPMALTVLAPIVVHIVAFHVFLAPSGLPLAVVILGLEVFLAWSYRGAFRSVLKARDDGALAADESARTARLDAPAH
ncbi:MAG TPA: DoxX family protein, partial [Polyangiaceae bacterium]|nr:DoxX family protein [Polyangiaceae bacterium]